MAKKYLDLEGLAYFAEKIREEKDITSDWTDLTASAHNGFTGTRIEIDVKIKIVSKSLILLSIVAGPFDSSAGVVMLGGLTITFSNSIFGNRDGLSCALVASNLNAIYSVVANGDTITFNRVTSGGTNDSFASLVVFPFVFHELIME
jgi:hypothetical protein